MTIQHDPKERVFEDTGEPRELFLPTWRRDPEPRPPVDTTFKDPR